MSSQVHTSISNRAQVARAGIGQSRDRLLRVWRRRSAAPQSYPPIGFYRAYPGVAVLDIKALVADAKVGAASS